MMRKNEQKYARGDLVEVLSLEEIYATLDERGCLDNLPFMPEMARLAGQRFRVQRRADRTCIEGHGDHEMTDAVFLEGVRCDGAMHDGCQRGCLMFWKEAWLKPAVGDAPAKAPAKKPVALSRELPVKMGDRYFCQSTELHRATRQVPNTLSRSLGLLVRDLVAGEIAPTRFTRILLRTVTNWMRAPLGLPPLGSLKGPGTETSKGSLDLKPGERVAIRPPEVIAQTLDQRGKNRGLTFDQEMTTYGGEFEVERKVERIILETNGRMLNLTNTVVLKGLTCQGLCAKNCPRANPIFWREIWLDRTSETAGAPSESREGELAGAAQKRA